MEKIKSINVLICFLKKVFKCLSDAIEAFKILKVNGLMFFDDFLQHDDNRILQSYVGIDKFLSLYSDYLKIEYFQNNLVVRKK